MQEILKNTGYISTEVLSDKIEVVNSLSIFDEIEIDDVKFKVNVNKIWSLINESWYSGPGNLKSQNSNFES